MLEQKLTIGEFIHFRFPPPPPGGFAQTPAVFETVLPTMHRIAESSMFSPDVRKVKAGAHATKGFRTFGWLPWLPGAIAEVAMGANDVLTGPMSGCDLVMYMRNGALHAGHLGTDVGAVAQNASVKATWNAFAIAAGAPNIIGGFNPFLDWVGPYPAATPADVGTPTFLGLYTMAHTFYTLVLYSQRLVLGNPSAHMSLRRIAGLQLINSKTYVQLCNL